MRIAYLTAGAAGMYCGSCLHDNALAKALIRQGHDAILIPTYTPILTDEANISSDKLFYGGLNVYLQQLSPVFRWIPRQLDSFLSSPRLVSWIANRAMGTSAKNLGALTVSMLRGADGNQRKEVRRLCDWLKTFNPDVVVFSNLLIAGCAPVIQEQLQCKVVVLLQGDDIFYENLIEPFQSQAMRELRRLANAVDLFVTHSEDYRQRMSNMLEFPVSRSAVCTLSIDPEQLIDIQPSRSNDDVPVIGYLARLAPEKGLHLLVDAYIEMRRRNPHARYRLAIAGWLGNQHAEYWKNLESQIVAAGFEGDVQYWGAINREQKISFLSSIDLLCVPTVYQEPKGLFALEGMAAAVPYLLPEHGAFPELHQRAKAGSLFTPNSSDALTDALIGSLSNRAGLRELGDQGRRFILEQATTEHSAREMAALLERLLESD